MDNLDLTALSSNEPGLDWFHVAALEWYSRDRVFGPTCGHYHPNKLLVRVCNRLTGHIGPCVSGVVSRNHALIWTIVK